MVLFYIVLIDVYDDVTGVHVIEKVIGAFATVDVRYEVKQVIQGIDSSM